MTFRTLGFTTLLFTVAILSGCGRQDDARVASQVAAKVNGEEITVHQVNYILARTPNVTPDAMEKVKHEILNRLIDQQLEKQQAIDKKLDRSPQVIQAIEASRDEILVRAYLEQLAAAQAKPTVEEAKKYYTEHPELFAKRRVFNLEEIIILPKADLLTGLREQVSKAQSMQNITAWLKSQDARFSVNRGGFAAEQISLELLARLQAMKVGEIGLIEAGGRMEVLHIVAFEEAPVDEATAVPRIQQFLFNRRATDVVAKEIKRIKEKAEIIYVGEFAIKDAATEIKPAAKTELLLSTAPLAPNNESRVR